VLSFKEKDFENLFPRELISHGRNGARKQSPSLVAELLDETGEKNDKSSC
jgi:hypothetical protein